MISVLDGHIKPRRCYFCGAEVGLHRHHVFDGPNRHLSEKYGLTANICWRDHIGNDGVHFNREKEMELKQAGQRAFERAFIERKYREDDYFYSISARERFKSIFGKYYIGEGE